MILFWYILILTYATPAIPLFPISINFVFNNLHFKEVSAKSVDSFSELQSTFVNQATRLSNICSLINHKSSKHDPVASNCLKHLESNRMNYSRDFLNTLRKIPLHRSSMTKKQYYIQCKSVVFVYFQLRWWGTSVKAQASYTSLWHIEYQWMLSNFW